MSPFQTIHEHIRQFFTGHRISEHQWTLGPVPEVMPEFRVLEIAPGPRSGCWIYASLGSSLIAHEGADLYEFFLIAPRQELQHVEHVTMAAWYHQTDQLGWGHTVPIGHPWIQGSLCDHFLISTPCPFGPELEVCNVDGGPIHVLWLLPITAAERDFKRANGIEALEQLSDEAAIEYWEPLRASVA